MLLFLVLLLLFGYFGGGHYWRSRDGSFHAGGGIGLGTVLLLCLTVYLLDGRL
jgi:hypothetical protein